MIIEWSSPRKMQIISKNNNWSDARASETYLLHVHLNGNEQHVRESFIYPLLDSLAMLVGVNGEGQEKCCLPDKMLKKIE